MHPILLNDIDLDCFRTLCENHKRSESEGTTKQQQNQIKGVSRKRNKGENKSGGVAIDYGGRECLIVCDSMTNLIREIESGRYELPTTFVPSLIGGGSDNVEKRRLDVLVGGMPCQSFSHAGLRKGIEDERGKLLLQFADLIHFLFPRVFVVENVRGLMTHEEGRTLKEVLKVLSMNGNYIVHHKLLDAWDYGVPQKRERIFIVGVHHSVEDAWGYKFPEKLLYRPTLRESIGAPSNPVPASEGMRYSENKRLIFEKIPMGGCWVDLPTEEEKKAYMGKSYYATGGRRGVLRRLSFDKPSPTLLCNPQAKQSELCHPTETRPLTIREYARIQTFPDEHTFCGSMASQYRQIGNAVPVNLAYHVGLSIVEFLNKKDIKVRCTTSCDAHLDKRTSTSSSSTSTSSSSTSS